MKKKPKETTLVPKSFLDMIAPGVVKFYTEHYICGSSYRSVWALREYPTTTDEQAILRHLGEKDGVTLHIYTRQVSSAEEKAIIQNSANRNRMGSSQQNDLQQAVTAAHNLQDVTELVATMHRDREPLLHCAVYIEQTAASLEALHLLQAEVFTELVRSKLNVDKLLLRQQEGFRCVMPGGRNIFGSRYERVLPVSSVANLYPLNYSGKADPGGLYLGRDKYGSNILVDFQRRAADKTNANILILGNSGEGKSYLLKLLLCNLLESGMSLLVLDPELEYVDLTQNLGGCYIDLMAGKYIINVLEPRCVAQEEQEGDNGGAISLSQHISYLRDFFRSYKSFSDAQLDVLEIMLQRLYGEWQIGAATDFATLTPNNYPILSDLYGFMEKQYQDYTPDAKELYTPEMLQEVLLGLHSLCVGADSRYFNGHTNITSNRFITFGVKGLLEGSQNIQNALLMCTLAYMTHQLLTVGNTAAALDELYLFLDNPLAIRRIRNALKRVRKKESSMLLASQNIEDFLLPGVAAYTKPLFSIPTHQFLFNPGSIDAKPFMDTLQLEPSEYQLIRFPQRGVCLYRCGSERYNLKVHAPAHKEALFGKAGGR